MLKLAAALFILLGLTGAASAQAVAVGGPSIACNQSFQVSQAAVALTKIVSSVANKQIAICGWSFNAGAAAATAQLQFGSGTNCGTGTTSLTPAISLGINGIWVDRQAVAWTSLARGIDLCLVTTGTGPAQVTVYYGIF